MLKLSEPEYVGRHREDRDGVANWERMLLLPRGNVYEQIQDVIATYYNSDHNNGQGYGPYHAAAS